MGNIHQYDENVRTRFGGYATDFGDNNITSKEFVDMANYDLVVGVGLATEVAVGSTVTLTMYQATDTAGADSAAVSSTIHTSTGSTEGIALVAQVRGEDLSTSSAFHYVGWVLDSNDADNTTIGSGCLLQMRGRYKQASLPA